MPSENLGPIRLSTNAVPERDRRAYFQEEIARKLLCTEFVDRGQGKFRFDVAMTAFGPVLAGTIAGTPSEFHRTRRSTGSTADRYSLLISNRGSYRHISDSTTVEIPPGHAVLINHGTQGKLEAITGGTTQTLMVERKILQGLMRRADDRVGRPIARDDPVLSLLKACLRAAQRLGENAPPGVELVVGEHMTELMAHTGVGLSKPASINELQGIRTARRIAIVLDMDEHATDPEFSIVSVAHRHRVTTRYIQALLEETGLTFSEHVLQRRLAAALRLLQDPAKIHLRITDIAFEAGFSDLPYFNRAFRRRYGDTPTAFRTARDIAPRG